MSGESVTFYRLFTYKISILANKRKGQIIPHRESEMMSVLMSERI